MKHLETIAPATLRSLFAGFGQMALQNWSLLKFGLQPSSTIQLGSMA